MLMHLTLLLFYNFTTVDAFNKITISRNTQILACHILITEKRVTVVGPKKAFII